MGHNVDVSVCAVLCLSVCTVMDWQAVQNIFHISPAVNWDTFQDYGEFNLESKAH